MRRFAQQLEVSCGQSPSNPAAGRADGGSNPIGRRALMPESRGGRARQARSMTESDRRCQGTHNLRRQSRSARSSAMLTIGSVSITGCRHNRGSRRGSGSAGTTLWALPIGAAALLCLIALAQSLRELPTVTPFIQNHPGIAQSAPSVAQRGRAIWTCDQAHRGRLRGGT